MEGNMKKYSGFTLAEVLITLAVIGVVAAMTLPIVINKINDMQFKVAYKKAYSDLSQVVQRALQEDEMPYRNNQWDTSATTAEFAVFKKYLKVTKECQPAQLASCWASGEKVSKNRFPASSKVINSSSFIDSSNRSWAEYNDSENLYLVDTNGMKAPNRFGKDRFIFTFMGQNKARHKVGIPVGVTTYLGDMKNIDTDWCPSGGCYYRTWLYK